MRLTKIMWILVLIQLFVLNFILGFAYFFFFLEWLVLKWNFKLIY